MDQNKIGKHIEELRKEKGLTQKELAEKLGLSNTAISKWECGCNLPDISMLEPLSKVLNIDIMELINPQKTIERKTENKPEEIPESQTLEIGKIKKIFLIAFNVTACIFIVLLSLFLTKKTTNSKNAEIAASNNIKVYEITSEDPSFYINGYLMFNEKENYFILNKIKYQGSSIGTEEPISVQEATIFLTINEDIIYMFNKEQNKKDNDDINELLTKLINDINDYKCYDVSLSEYEEYLEDSIIVVKYKNKKGENKRIDIKLSVNQQFT